MKPWFWPQTTVRAFSKYFHGKAYGTQSIRTQSVPSLAGDDAREKIDKPGWI